MIYSMTGFGRASREASGVAFEVEARSVNHRHLDLRIRLPRMLADRENSLKQKVQGRLARGKVEIVVNLSANAATAKLVIDESIAGQYVEAARTLSSRHALTGALDVASLHGIIAPGGWAPDKLRRIPAVLDAVRAVHAAGKMVASICHGPWILISAGVVRGRMLTGSLGIRDDLVNAGALWIDQPSVIDGNIVSARVPKDLPAFGLAMLEVLRKQ